MLKKLYHTFSQVSIFCKIMPPLTAANDVFSLGSKMMLLVMLVIQKSTRICKCFFLAQREGFEPSNKFWLVTRFPIVRLRPARPSLHIYSVALLLYQSLNHFARLFSFLFRFFYFFHKRVDAFCTDSLSFILLVIFFCHFCGDIRISVFLGKIDSALIVDFHNLNIDYISEFNNIFNLVYSLRSEL